MYKLLLFQNQMKGVDAESSPQASLFLITQTGIITPNGHVYFSSKWRANDYSAEEEREEFRLSIEILNIYFQSLNVCLYGYQVVSHGKLLFSNLDHVEYFPFLFDFHSKVSQIIRFILVEPVQCSAGNHQHLPRTSSFPTFASRPSTSFCNPASAYSSFRC